MASVVRAEAPHGLNLVPGAIVAAAEHAHQIGDVETKDELLTILAQAAPGEGLSAILGVGGRQSR